MTPKACSICLMIFKTCTEETAEPAVADGRIRGAGGLWGYACDVHLSYLINPIMFKGKTRGSVIVRKV